MSKIEQTGTAFAKAIADEIADIRTNMVTKDDLREALKNVATKDDLKNFATKDDLKNFATKDDLKNFATKDDIRDMVTKSDLQEALQAMARELITVINTNTLSLRNDLNREFEKAGLPVKLDVTPRRSA